MIANAINEEAGGKYEYVYDRHAVRQKRGAQELGISSVRGGGIVGDHDVLFCGPEEVVTISMWPRAAVCLPMALYRQHSSWMGVSRVTTP